MQFPLLICLSTSCYKTAGRTLLRIKDRRSNQKMNKLPEAPLQIQVYTFIPPTASLNLVRQFFQGIFQQILGRVDTRRIPFRLVNRRLFQFCFWILKGYHHKRSIKLFSAAWRSMRWLCLIKGVTFRHLYVSLKWFRYQNFLLHKMALRC
jgi:hypothetical protein